MPFEITRTDELQPVGSGVIDRQIQPLITSATTFESGLKIGQIAKLDSGSIDNLDGSATPTLAGLVVRDTANAIESEGTYVTTGDGAIHTIDVQEWGLGTVDVDTSVTINKFQQVYAINVAGANQGKVTNVSTNNFALGDSYFYEEIQTGVWKIFVRLSPTT